MTRALACTLLALCCALGTARAAPSDDDLPPGGPGLEPVDRTRLDVARLPPEAATVTRADYHRGLFLEAHVGALALAGDARNVSRPGPRFAVALGYELTQWLALVVELDTSMHQTRNRPPPSHTSFELLGGALGARVGVPIGTRWNLWASGLAGVAWSSGDVLRGLGYRDAHKLGLSYGGEVGFDWHLRARHHALGVLGGVRALPSLGRDGFTLGGYGAAYLRYVF